MASDSINKRINIYINGEAVKTEAEAIRKKMVELQGSMAGMDKDSDAFKVAEAKMKSLGNMLDAKVTPSIKNLKAEMTRLANETGRMKGDEIGGEKYIANMKRMDELRPILKQHADAVRGVSNEVEKAGGGLSKWQAGIAGFAGGLATKAVDMVAGALQGIGNYIESSVEEWDKATQAEKKLQNALKGREEIVPRLIEESEKLQSSMNIPHELIQDQEAFLGAQGRTEEQIKKTIQAAIQMAAVTGRSLPDAVKMLSGSFEGQLRGLNRLDAGIANLTKEQLANGVAVDIINAKYKGFAETAANEGLGPVKQIGMILGEFKENLGGFLAGVLLPMAGGLKGLANEMRLLVTPVKSLNEQVSEQSGKVVDLQDNIDPLLKRYDMLMKKAKDLGGETHLSKQEHSELADIIKKVTEAMPGAVTAEDSLGNAIAISTSRVREYIQAEKDRLGVMNADAISENYKKKIEAAKKVLFYENEVKKINDGTYTVTDVSNASGSGNNVRLNERKATQQEIDITIAAHKVAIHEYNGYVAQQDLLNGDSLERKRESNRKINSESNAQLKEQERYNRMSVDQLTKILDNSDGEDPEKMMADKALVVAKKREEGNKKVQEDYKKQHDYLLKIQTLYEEASAQSVIASKDREIAIEQASALKKLAEITGHTLLEEETKIKIKEASARKIQDINSKYDQAEVEKFLTVEKEKADRKLQITADYQPLYLQMAIRFIEIERDISLNNDKLTADERININEKFMQQKLATEIAYGKARMKLVDRDLSNEASRYKAQSIKDDSNQTFGYENKKKLLDLEYNTKITAAINAGKSTFEIDAQNYADKRKLAEDYYGFLAGKIQQYGDFAKSAFSSIDQIMQNSEKKQLDTATKANDKKKVDLKKQLDAKLISQTDYDAKVAALDEDLDAKKRKVEHDQAVRTKIMNVFQAGLNIASAITAALAPPTIWMVPIIAALGALQMAAILSTPIPAMAEGGPIPKEQIIRAGEAGREWMAPNWMVEDSSTGPIIAMLEQTRLGKRSGRMPDFGAMESAAGRISGGSVVNTTIINQPGNNEDFQKLRNELADFHDTMKELKVYMSDPNNRQATINREMLSKFDKDEAALRALANIR